MCGLCKLCVCVFVFACVYMQLHAPSSGNCSCWKWRTSSTCWKSQSTPLNSSWSTWGCWRGTTFTPSSSLPLIHHPLTHKSKFKFEAEQASVSVQNGVPQQMSEMTWFWYILTSKSEEMDLCPIGAFLPAGCMWRTQPVGPKIALHFPCLFVCILVSWYDVSTALICPTVMSRTSLLCDVTMLPWLTWWLLWVLVWLLWVV